jgi:hypothetical protein
MSKRVAMVEGATSRQFCQKSVSKSHAAHPLRQSLEVCPCTSAIPEAGSKDLARLVKEVTAMKVGDIMTRNVVSCRKDADIGMAARLMLEGPRTSPCTTR